MDINAISEKLLKTGEDTTKYIDEVAKEISTSIRSSSLKIIDLAKGLDPVLTNGSYEIRAKGVHLMSQVITSLPKGCLIIKEVEVLSEFIRLRLVDHKSMESSSLKCLSYFIDCENKPDRFSMNLLEFLKESVNVKKMDQQNRKLVYLLLKQIVQERRSKSANADSSLIYSIVHLLEDESNPENLLICFSIISYILKQFQELDPYIDEIFDWLSSYYPIDYTPSEQCLDITRADLIEALYDCFYANPLNADNLQTLLLEKLESNTLSVKLETLGCLVKCYETFPVTSIRNYTSTLWTAIRMECLKKVSLVNQDLLEASYRALSALTKCLSQDNEVYFVYVSDMYDELSIAFRKPEMDLFEPAARLITHAIIPKLEGFNYVLGKLLPIVMQALASQELRPAAGLTYLMQKLGEHHSDCKLAETVNDQVDNILKLISEPGIKLNETLCALMMAIFSCRLTLSDGTSRSVTDRLLGAPDELAIQTDECLASFCYMYKRTDIIYDKPKDGDNPATFEWMIQEVPSFDASDKKQAKKYTIYLRFIVKLLDSARVSDINGYDPEDLNTFLSSLRDTATKVSSNNPILLESIAHIHAILTNKLDAGKLATILMPLFSSPFCQNLAPEDADCTARTTFVYLPILKYVMKSLVIRNHQLAWPLVNLMLNFITAPSVDSKLAQEGTMVFSFVLSDDGKCNYDASKDYQLFSLYKQKFYMQTVKEIKIRHAKESKGSKKTLLMIAVAVQVPHLPAQVYRKDHEWLLRELLRILSTTKEGEATAQDDVLLRVIFESIEYLVENATDNDVTSFVGSLVELNLKFGQTGSSLQTRQLALNCLARLATSISPSDLLAIRPKVIDGLRTCLGDKKRLVRQAAARARLQWTLVGQPIGG